MEFFRGLQKVGQLWKLMYYKNISFLEFEWAKKKSYIFDGMKARKQVKRVRAQMITRLSILRHLNEYHRVECWVLTVHSMRFEFQMSHALKWPSERENKSRYPIWLLWRIIVSQSIHQRNVHT